MNKELYNQIRMLNRYMEKLNDITWQMGYEIKSLEDKIAADDAGLADAGKGEYIGTEKQWKKYEEKRGDLEDAAKDNFLNK